MGQVLALLPEIELRDRLATEFIDHLRAERNLNYVEIGDAHERIERTLNRYYLFQQHMDGRYRRYAFREGDLAAGTDLLRREWIHKPVPTAREVVDRLLALLADHTSLLRNGDRSATSTVTPLFARKK